MTYLQRVRERRREDCGNISTAATQQVKTPPRVLQEFLPLVDLAMTRVASLYRPGAIAHLTAEQERRWLANNERLENALKDAALNPVTEIIQWEKIWIELLREVDGLKTSA